MKNGTEQGENEIADLLSTIRAKRDMGSFLASPPKVRGEKSEDVEGDRVEALTIKTVKNTEGVSSDKKARSKPMPKSILSETALSDFLKTVQEAEAQRSYTFEQNKRHYVDDHHFQTLVLLKNVGRIRNISVLINTLIGEFIETHQTDIEQILQKKER